MLLLIVGLWIFWHTYTVWFAAFLAVCFTATLSGLARAITERTSWSYGWSLLAVCLLIVVLVGGLGLWMGPPLIAQGDALIERMPEAVDQGRAWLNERTWGRTLVEMGQQLPNSLGGEAVMGRITTVFSSTVGAAAGILAVIAITIFLAIDPKMYMNGLVSLVPVDRESRAREVLAHVGTALRWWMAGRLISMMIVGVCTGLGLWLVGVPLPWILGFIAGVLSFVPNLGPVIALIPGLLLASTVSGQTVAWALGVYVGVQLVESNLITPMVQKYAVSVPPALLLTLQLVLGVLFGVMGLLVATPLLVAGVVAMQMLYVHDQLGRDVSVMGQHDED